MKMVIGLIIAVACIILGFYIGIAWMLVPGLVGFFHQLGSENPDASIIAWSIVKVLFCEAPIVVSIWIGVLIGFFSLKD
jgi:hypothetical protein